MTVRNYKLIFIMLYFIGDLSLAGWEIIFRDSLVERFQSCASINFYAHIHAGLLHPIKYILLYSWEILAN